MRQEYINYFMGELIEKMRDELSLGLGRKASWKLTKEVNEQKGDFDFNSLFEEVSNVTCRKIVENSLL